MSILPEQVWTDVDRHARIHNDTILMTSNKCDTEIYILQDLDDLGGEIENIAALYVNPFSISLRRRHPTPAKTYFRASHLPEDIINILTCIH